CARCCTCPRPVLAGARPRTGLCAREWFWGKVVAGRIRRVPGADPRWSNAARGVGGNRRRIDVRRAEPPARRDGATRFLSGNGATPRGSARGSIRGMRRPSGGSRGGNYGAGLLFRGRGAAAWTIPSGKTRPAPGSESMMPSHHSGPVPPGADDRRTSCREDEDAHQPVAHAPVRETLPESAGGGREGDESQQDEDDPYGEPDDRGYCGLTRRVTLCHWR